MRKFKCSFCNKEISLEDKQTPNSVDRWFGWMGRDERGRFEACWCCPDCGPQDNESEPPSPETRRGFRIIRYESGAVICQHCGEYIQHKDVEITEFSNGDWSFECPRCRKETYHRG